MTVWEHLLYYSSRIVQILFQAGMSGDFGAFLWKGEFIAKAEPPYDDADEEYLRKQISPTE